MFGQQRRFVDEEHVLSIGRESNASEGVAMYFYGVGAAPGLLWKRQNASWAKSDWKLECWDGSDGKRMLSMVSDEGVDLFPLENEGKVNSTRLDSLMPHHEGRARLAAFDPQSGLLAVSSGAGIQIYKRRDKIKPTFVQSELRTNFWSAASSDAGNWVCAVNQGECNVEFLSHDGQRSSSRPLEWPAAREGMAGYPWGMSITPDESKLAVLWQEADGGGITGSNFGSKAILIYDLCRSAGADGTLRLQRRISLPGFDGIAGYSNRIISLTPDGQGVIFATSQVAQVFGTEDGKKRHEIMLASANTVSHGLSPDGSLVAGASYRDVVPVTVWDVATGNKIFQSKEAGRVNRIAISPDNQRVFATWGADGRNPQRMCGWDIRSGKLVLDIKTQLVPLAISPVGDRFIGFIADANTVGSAVLADLNSGEPIQVLNAESHILTVARYSPDGAALLLGMRRYGCRVFRSVTPEKAAALLETVE